MSKRLTRIIQAEGQGFVSLGPELDIASQGDTIEDAQDNLREALELFFECASPAEVRQRLKGPILNGKARDAVQSKAERWPKGGTCATDNRSRARS